MFKDKIIAITDGTGSFRRPVVNLFLKTDVREIRIFSRDEKKQEEMRTNISSERTSSQTRLYSTTIPEEKCHSTQLIHMGSSR